MANKYVKALVAVVLLIIMVFILQLIVGVFGVASSTANTTFLSTPGFFTLATSNGVVSANAVNDLAANALTMTFTGTTTGISSAYPLTVTVTGNTISTYATSNNVYATPGTSNTQIFVVTSASGTQTLCSGCGNFYNFTKITLTGATGTSYPSITGTVTQTFLAYPHGIAGQGGVVTVNTISQSGTATITLTPQGTQFGQVGASNATIIPFITVIVIVALVVILLDLFGLGDILNLKTSE